MKEWIAKDTRLPLRVEARVLIELRPGDIPGLSNDIEKLTVDIKDQASFRDYGKPVLVALPSAATGAQETSLGRLGVTEYMNYRPPQPTPTPAPQQLPGTNPPSAKDGNTMRWPSPPAMSISPDRDYVATIKTNLGDVVVQLFPKDAPLAVNNFVFLAQQGFYNGVKFHRVVKGFVIQTGDPTGTGAGDPGYKFPDERVTRDYVTGTLAMANSGPNTNGSQFFITLADLSGRLPKNYTIFGTVTSGFDVVQKIGNVPVTFAANGELSRPTSDVHIDTIAVEEK